MPPKPRACKTQTNGRRIQFRKLTKAQKAAVSAALLEPFTRAEGETIVARRLPQAVTGLSDATALFPPFYGIRCPGYDYMQRGDLSRMIQPPRAHMRSFTVRVGEIYLQHICHLLNVLAGCHEIGGPNPQLKAISYDVRFWENFGHAEFTEDLVVDEEYVPVRTRLLNDGIPDTVFDNLNHFMLIVTLSPNHAQYLHISPSTRTMSYFDSENVKSDRIMGYASGLYLVSCIMGDAFAPCEWRIRRDMGSRQGYSANCVVFAMSNAQSLAFGYSTDFSGCNFLDRRWKIAHELLNTGFALPPAPPSDEYFYPVTPFPETAAEIVEYRSYSKGYSDLLEDKAICALFRTHRSEWWNEVKDRPGNR